MTKQVGDGKLSRRGLLRGGVIGIALVGLGGLGLALQKTKLAAIPSAGLRVLTPEQYSVLHAIAARICPSKSGKVPGTEEIDVALIADRMLEYADADLKAGLATALSIIESGAVGALFFERTAPFTQLSAPQQDAVLLAFKNSKVAIRPTIFRSLSALLGSLYYGDPRSWPSIGYPGPPDPNGLRVAYAPQLVDWAALRPSNVKPT